MPIVRLPADLKGLLQPIDSVTTYVVETDKVIYENSGDKISTCDIYIFVQNDVVIVDTWLTEELVCSAVTTAERFLVSTSYDNIATDLIHKFKQATKDLIDDENDMTDTICKFLTIIVNGLSDSA